MEKLLHPADQLCKIMERIYDVDMTSLTGGNASVMDDEGVMWVTPTSIDKKSLTRDDIVRILPDGTIEGRHKPTSEYHIHRKILTERKDIRAVIHAHAPASVTLSLLGKLPETKLCWKIYDVVGDVAMTPYVLPGTMELADTVLDAFKKGYDAAILEKHSAFVGSKLNLMDAFHRFEAMDIAARIQINSFTVGNYKIMRNEKLSCKFMEKSRWEEKEFRTHACRELDARRMLAQIMQRGYKKKLFAGTLGVMSVRTGDDSFVITPYHGDNGTVTAEDTVLIDGSFREKGKQPHDTAALHQEIYRLHPEINAVILACPVHAMTFAVTERPYETTLYPESYGVLREGRRYTYEEFCSDTEKVACGTDLEHPMALIENYGILLAGSSPILAFDKLEVCESGAQSIHESLRMGIMPPLMTKEQIDEMNNG